jgi:protein-S-isoprenylcysteine O-methyltransferase Ste14
MRSAVAITSECRIPPLVYLLIFAAFAYGLRLYWPGYVFAQPLASSLGTFLGAFVGLIGMTVALLAALQFRTHKTTVSPLNPEHVSELVTTGLFHFSRNPMYLGMLLMLAGWVLALGGLSGVIVAPLFVWTMTRVQILPEERALQKHFEHRFLRYKNTVRRWL